MSDLVFEKLSQALAAGESWRLNIAGDFFRLSEAAYPVSVSLLKGLRIVGTMRNMLAGDYVRDIQFDGVIIDNGTVAQNVSAQIAGGGAGSDRVIGEVSVINGELARVKGGRCFVGVSGLSMLAGNYNFHQLMNPAGSGKNVVVNKVSAAVSSPAAIGIEAYAAPMATLVGQGVSKMFGGAQSAAQLRTGQSASNPAAVITNIFLPVANETREFQFSEPIIVPPGSSAMIFVSTVNLTSWVNFQWNEEDI